MPEPVRQIEPEFFEKLGRLLQHWALLDARLVDLLAACLHADPGMTLLLAHTVSGATITDWVRKMSSVLDTPEDSLKKLESILREIDELRADRNALVHGVWATDASDTGTILVQTVRLHGMQPVRQRLVTLADLDELICITLEIYERLRAFLLAHRLLGKGA